MTNTTPPRGKRREGAIGHPNFRLAGVASGHDIKIHRHLPFREFGFHNALTGKVNG